MRRSYGSSIIQRDTISSAGCLGPGLLKVRFKYTNSFLVKNSLYSYSPTICNLVEQWISGKRWSACWTLAYPEQRGICVLCQPGMGGGVSSALGANHLDDWHWIIRIIFPKTTSPDLKTFLLINGRRRIFGMYPCLRMNSGKEFLIFLALVTVEICNWFVL